MTAPVRKARASEVELGLGEEHVNLGDHIAYFWEKPAEFAQATEFLLTGHRRGEHLVVFGHNEANARVLDILESKGLDVGQLMAAGRLSVLSGGPTGDGMLATIGGVFQKAIDGGAACIRLLGNIGWGHPDWPNDLDILEFEAKVTGAAKKFPSVVVCMYDINSASGRQMVRGAYETHPLTFNRNLVRENPFYVGVDDYLARHRETDALLTEAD